MDLWNTFRSQITTLWKQWSLQQRFMIVGAAIVCLSAVFGTLFWATRPEYQVIASDLSPQRAAQILGALEDAQITAKTNFGSTSVSVPRASVGEARLALKDVYEPPVSEGGGIMSGFPGTPAAENDRRLRSLESRVARSIELLRGVDAATVLISRPDPTPFTRDRTDPTASVTITPAGRGRLTSSDGQAIVMLVARAVQALTPENVTLMDTSGNQYSVAGGPGGSGMSVQLEYQRSVELDLAQKAESILVSMLGEGKAQVRVTADIDFRETSRTETTFDPDGKVKRTENIESVSHDGSTGFGGGVAGGDGRRVGDDAGDLGGGGNYTRESNTTDYDHASTSLTTREAPGMIQRLTVAAVVDLGSPSTAADPAANTGDAARVASAVTAEQVENIIKQAVGFDEQRLDQLAVTIAPLAGIVFEPEVPTMMTFYQEYKPLVESVLVGLAATVAFLVAVLALRKIKPVSVGMQTAERFTREDYQRMASLSEKVQHDPELAAHVVSTWMGKANPSGQSDDDTGRSSQRQARAA